MREVGVASLEGLVFPLKGKAAGFEGWGLNGVPWSRNSVCHWRSKGRQNKITFWWQESGWCVCLQGAPRRQSSFSREDVAAKSSQPWELADNQSLARSLKISGFLLWRKRGQLEARLRQSLEQAELGCPKRGVVPSVRYSPVGSIWLSMCIWMRYKTGPIRREQRKNFHVNGECSQLGLLATFFPPPSL